MTPFSACCKARRTVVQPSGTARSPQGRSPQRSAGRDRTGRNRFRSQGAGRGDCASIHNQYRTAARQDAALQGAVDGLKLATLSEQDRGVRYNILKREVDTNRQLYDSLLQRYK
jgi:uncharacterized protein involved in exopolysaccharide biosynthesis